MLQGPGAERRTATRHRVCLVVQLRAPDGSKRTAVVRDASQSGVFVLTREAPIRVGDPVELEVVPFDDDTPAPWMKGRVVRAKPWEAGDLWRQAIAVKFDYELSSSRELEELSANVGDGL